MAAQLTKIVALTMALFPLAALGQDHSLSPSHSQNAAPYAGFQDREIKSLSDQDIQELRRGGGWGLALPAELNGRPGPAHLLELKDELELTAEQVEAISVIYEDMRTSAITAAERFISAEAALNDAFAGPELTDEALRDLLAEAAQARSDLRFIHLSRHLSTPDLLNQTQIRKYQTLRGYADDPCATVPEGHDPDMWRRHNGCD